MICDHFINQQELKAIEPSIINVSYTSSVMTDCLANQISTGYRWVPLSIMNIAFRVRGLELWCLSPYFTISCRSDLLVEETGLLGKTTDLPQVTGKLYHLMLIRLHLTWAGFELTTLEVIMTDCIGSCKSNYHSITTTPLVRKKRTCWGSYKQQYIRSCWWWQSIVQYIWTYPVQSNLYRVYKGQPQFPY